MTDITTAWTRLETALGKDAKRLAARAGTTVAKIEAAEKKLKFALPTELRTWLQLHDGQKSGDGTLSVLSTGGPLLALKDVVDFWKMQQREAAPDEEEGKPQDKGRIRWLLSHPRRIPIGGDFEMGGGTFIDQIPAKKGTADQIIALVSECDFMLVSRTLAAMFDGTAALVERKKLHVVDDPLRLEPTAGESGYGGWTALLQKA